MRAQLDEDAKDHDLWHYGDCGSVSDDASACDCGLPAWVLRGVEAKRKAISCRVGGLISFRERDLAADLLELLAAPYADRPGYRQEWAPG